MSSGPRPSETAPRPAATDPRLARVVEAGLLLASELSMPVLLRRLVEVAVDVTGARYGALGVAGPDGEVEQFITVGVDDATRAAIGDPPTGRGLIGALLADPRPLRLARLQADPRSVGFPPHHPPMTTFVGAPVRAGSRLFGALYLTERRGGTEFDEGDQTALVAVAAQAGVAIANAVAYTALRERQRLLEVLASVTEAALSDGPVATVLDVAVGGVRQLTRAELAVLVLAPATGGGGSELRVAAAEGAQGGRLTGTAAPPCALDRGADSCGNCRAWLAPSDPAAWVAAARLERRGAVAGGLLVVRRGEAGAFTGAERGQLRAVTGQVVLALDAAEARAAQALRAVAAERLRIARDLHDEPVQVLVYLARELEGLGPQLGADDRAHGRLQEARGLVLGVAEELRQVAEGLRSTTLEERGLPAALAELSERVRLRSGLAVELRTDPLPERVAPELELGCLRIAQEALTNVERHARAGRVRVRLDRRGRGLRLAVTDDGVGFAGADGTRPSPSLGFAGMRERAAQLGGHLWVRSRPGRGTVVIARLPAVGAAPPRPGSARAR